MATSTKRKAAPRKGSAAAAQNGHTNGHSVAEVAPPEKFEEAPKVEAPEKPAVTHPYGNVQVYTYQPRNGSAPIVFPAITEVTADAYFFWKIYDMNEMFQAFEWMKKAQVPRDIQSRVMMLDDAEKQAFFGGWFNAITSPQGVTPPGES